MREMGDSRTLLPALSSQILLGDTLQAASHSTSLWRLCLGLGTVQCKGPKGGGRACKDPWAGDLAVQRSGAGDSAVQTTRGRELSCVKAWGAGFSCAKAMVKAGPGHEKRGGGLCD